MIKEHCSPTCWKVIKDDKSIVYECKICGKEFDNSKSVSRHCSTKHTKKELDKEKEIYKEYISAIDPHCQTIDTYNENISLELIKIYEAEGGIFPKEYINTFLLIHRNQVAKGKHLMTCKKFVNNIVNNYKKERTLKQKEAASNAGKKTGKTNIKKMSYLETGT